ncbi:MAG: pentapeptide repeat-containing protein [Pseudoruegeria sp.]
MKPKQPLVLVAAKEEKEPILTDAAACTNVRSEARLLKNVQWISRSFNPRYASRVKVDRSVHTQGASLITMQNKSKVKAQTLGRRQTNLALVAKRNQITERRDRSRLTTFARKFRSHPVVLLVESIAILAAIVAALLFVFDLKDRQTDRIIRSWETVSTTAPGKSGKIEALEFLNSESFCFGAPAFVRDLWSTFKNRGSSFPPPVDQRNVSDINEVRLRFHSVNSNDWRWCWKERVDLSGLQLGQDLHGGPVDLRGVNLSGANLSYSDFTGALLWEADLSEALIGVSSFRNAQLHRVDLRNTAIFGSDFRESRVSGQMKGARIYASTLDDAHIEADGAFDDTHMLLISATGLKLNAGFGVFSLSNGEEALSIGDGLEKTCDGLKLLAWSFDQSLPRLPDKCHREHVAIYADNLQVTETELDPTPMASQSKFVSEYGRMDFVVMNPDPNQPYIDHNQPFIGYGLIPYRIFDRDEIQNLWDEQFPGLSLIQPN